MPLLKASRFLNAFLHVFWCFFEGSDPKNSMVFTSPNQLSLLLQKVRFLSLFGHLLEPKVLTFGAPRGRLKLVKRCANLQTKIVHGVGSGTACVNFVYLCLERPTPAGGFLKTHILGFKRPFNSITGNEIYR